MRRLISISVLLILAVGFSGCGGGGSAPTIPSSIPDAGSGSGGSDGADANDSGGTGSGSTGGGSGGDRAPGDGSASSDRIRAPDFLAFETVATRPIAKVGNRVYVLNTRDNRVEIFSVSDAGALTPEGNIVVGMEPVALAALGESELWVVNHLSDSVSVVDLNQSPPVVRRTLLVDGEPRDIVFAESRAFIASARRGQHRNHPSLAQVPGAGDPRTHESGVGRADVWVFDANNPGDALGGIPIRILELFGDSPRALEVSADHSQVYAAVFHSGNQTSIVHEGGNVPWLYR